MKVKLDPQAFMPERAHSTDAGADLRTPIDFTLHPHCGIFIDTGVHIELPHNTVGIISSKSGLNKNKDITCTGVIDEGYTGSIGVKLYNLGTKTHKFKRGYKISQLLVLHVTYCDFEQVEYLEDTDRGDGGFGSTGR